MDHLLKLLVFRLDGQRYAVPLAVVERVVSAVEVTPLPTAPRTVLGVIDVHGRVLPVLSLRRKILRPDRDITPEDCFVVLHAAGRPVVLAVDEVQAVVERQRSEQVSSSEVAPGVDQFRGILKFDDGLVLIQDVDRFLSVDEDCALSAALSRLSPAGKHPPLSC